MLTSSKNFFKFKDEAKQAVSSFLKNTLSNYFKVESPDDQVYQTNKSIFAVLIHTCKRELSPAHLVCPWRHNA
jgi:hypothetical protein